MAITDLKFEAGDFANQDIASLPDRPGSIGMTAAQLKARFDNVGKALIALGNFNDLIDALRAATDGNSGADNIAVTAIATAAGSTVQAVLESLAANDDIKPGIAVTNGNLDDCLTAGVYYPLSTDLNLPVIGLPPYPMGLLLVYIDIGVIKTDTNSVHQFFLHNGGRLYYRRKFRTSAFGDWIFYDINAEKLGATIATADTIPNVAEGTNPQYFTITDYINDPVTLTTAHRARKVTWAAMQAAMKAYFDTLYVAK